MASWGIAFVEYWLAVPANRFGHAVYSAAELKTIQEVITLVVFCGFSVLYLKEPLAGTTPSASRSSPLAPPSSSPGGPERALMPLRNKACFPGGTCPVGRKRRHGVDCVR